MTLSKYEIDKAIREVREWSRGIRALQQSSGTSPVLIPTVLPSIETMIEALTEPEVVER